VNDGPDEARELARLLRGLLCHVNLIPWNHVEGLPHHPSSPATIAAFRDDLLSYGIPVTIRDTRGARITAACGQLRTTTERQRHKATMNA
jgi:23S rRNA (adenine2503-C2)-methyltransferase